jgi:hypothetical protein
LFEVFYKLLMRFKPVTMIKLTVGDTERALALQRSSAKLTAVTSFVAVTILISLAINIMSSYIYEHML